MVLPFPYRLITAWINNPGPDPLDGPTLEVVEAPWTCKSRPDFGPELSKGWVQLGGRLPLDLDVEAWTMSGYSPRLLHCGSKERLNECVVGWFDARVAHEEELNYFEFVLQEVKDLLEEEEGVPPMTFDQYIADNLIGLRGLHSGSGGIRDQELRGTYLVLSIAARGRELLTGPEQRISIVKQLAHLIDETTVIETGEEMTGIRLVDRFNTLVREYERFLAQIRMSGRHSTTTITTTTTSGNNSNNNNNSSWRGWPRRGRYSSRLARPTTPTR